MLKAKAFAALEGPVASAPGGVWKHGTQQEDSPVTWEALSAPLGSPAMRSAGDESPRSTCPRAHAATTRKSARPEVGRRRGTTGAEAEGAQGVGWPHRSCEAGKPRGGGSQRSKGGPCCRELQEGTMIDASTSKTMSPQLLKVVERAKREPEGRFHSLAHLIDVPALERAYHRMRKDAAVGVDGMDKA